LSNNIGALLKAGPHLENEHGQNKKGRNIIKSSTDRPVQCTRFDTYLFFTNFISMYFYKEINSSD